ncbi:translation initiation factor IF-2-like [Canis lupus familiaris]|uniref:translation initiation factor IF-2-like n=1 Tax=Canis lupus familiaris TaxID=9615 RepID=UPI0018F7D4D3|nr:translation initiation factor IF-2-like [Canis lupus familiaris]
MGTADQAGPPPTWARGPHTWAAPGSGGRGLGAPSPSSPHQPGPCFLGSPVAVSSDLRSPGVAARRGRPASASDLRLPARRTPPPGGPAEHPRLASPPSRRFWATPAHTPLGTHTGSPVVQAGLPGTHMNQGLASASWTIQLAHGHLGSFSVGSSCADPGAVGVEQHPRPHPPDASSSPWDHHRCPAMAPGPQAEAQWADGRSGHRAQPIRACTARHSSWPHAAPGPRDVTALGHLGRGAL